MLENFRKVHDVLIESVHLSLKKINMPKLSSEAHKLVQQYGICFKKIHKFTYLRVGGFKDEPMKLPQYALDCFILAKISKQLLGFIVPYQTQFFGV